jgi:hypothetical protein
MCFLNHCVYGMSQSGWKFILLKSSDAVCCLAEEISGPHTFLHPNLFWDHFLVEELKHCHRAQFENQRLGFLIGNPSWQLEGGSRKCAS